ncbi:uncharacterized protein LOC104418182 [Eucalyptus grandis]|nr:uncharacterized protein LOC104418182 [Eucalyptus grandis]
MAKKRKSVASRLDEVDRSLYTSFCSAANSLSQLYTQAMSHQRLSFQAGERHALEKLYQWILRQQEEGSRVSTIDIISYLQNELDYAADDTPMSPRPPPQLQNSQAAVHLANVGAPISSNPFGPAAIQGARSGNSDNQGKNPVFSNALSSPVRRSLQHYQSMQAGYNSNTTSSGNAARHNETNNPHHQIRDNNPTSSNDTSMDMHAESPGQDSHY